jgi:hypothetical protein
MQERTMWLATALLVAVAACGPRDGPLAPEDRQDSAALAAIDARSILPLTDVLTRVMPGLSGPDAAVLSTRLADLERAVGAGDRRAAGRALSEARRALATYSAGARSGGEADLDVIQLAMAAIGGDH